MVMEQVRRCDVFGTIRDVAAYKVVVAKVTTEGADAVETNVLHAGPVDLSPLAYERKAARKGGDDGN